MGISQVLVFVTVCLVIVGVYGALEPVKDGSSEELVVTKATLLTSSGSHSTTRIGGGSICSKDKIMVSQGPSGRLPSGIPTYAVNVENLCTLETCSISEIHLSCGPFSSARLVNPNIFRRIKIGDCLVNNGRPLESGATISFEYANTFMYPLSVSSVAC